MRRALGRRKTKQSWKVAAGSYPGIELCEHARPSSRCGASRSVPPSAHGEFCSLAPRPLRLSPYCSVSGKKELTEGIRTPRHSPRKLSDLRQVIFFLRLTNFKNLVEVVGLRMKLLGEKRTMKMIDYIFVYKTLFKSLSKRRVNQPFCCYSLASKILFKKNQQLHPVLFSPPFSPPSRCSGPPPHPLRSFYETRVSPCSPDCS